MRLSNRGRGNQSSVAFADVLFTLVRWEEREGKKKGVLGVGWRQEGEKSCTRSSNLRGRGHRRLSCNREGEALRV